ncbi:hypothetical protein AJ78_08583 [Emergomyces pasteurianus Ep9510]|uniref:Centrosomin N-terminal motif 1 domain-containing protein n=1 Tax=Emergomyces pasteurianus Ep9510 TaxID=1447872 RepID=A0A1J9P2I1_9EURO|nr:hypothetical protein AJ78_08583 [Emergomyces pasteurianus Ep9510]
MDTQHHKRHRLADGPASSPTTRVASLSQGHFSAEPSTPDHTHPSNPTAQRGSTKNVPAKIFTDTSRISASPSSIQPDTPQRNNDSAGSTPLVNPTSSLLQGLINEQRATRGARRATSEHPSDTQVQTPTTAPSYLDSSSEKQQKISNALSVGLKQPREMGMREMDQYVSKLNKLNFDLKLEIYHRSQHLLSLEKKLERMEALEEEVQRLQGAEEELQELREVEANNQRLRESNEHLRLELDRRDQAVNEAVELICQLEAKIETMEAANDDDDRPLTARPHTSEGLVASPTMTPKGTPIFDIPDRTSSWRGTTSSARSFRSRTETAGSSARRPRRHPSFFHESSGSTSALRSLYITAEEEEEEEAREEEAGTSRNGFSTDSRTGSFVSGYEAPETQSPRLSILSECSYLSPSATPSKQFEANLTSIGPLSRKFSQPISKLELSQNQKEENDVKMSRIDRWIQPQNDDLLIPARLKRQNYSPVEISETGSRKQQPSLGAAFQAKRPVKPYKFDTPRLDGPLFNGARLPPTPDTMSTSNADARNGSNSSIIAEKSLLDQGRFFANFSGSHMALRRPRSADDITTRPSTANTALSGTMETLTDATKQGINLSRNHLGSMFPTYDGHLVVVGSSDKARIFPRADLAGQSREEYAGKTQIANISTTTPNDDGGGGGGGGSLSARRRRYPPSLKSTHSEPQYGDSNSCSPPLTPHDWLEAALPVDGDKRHKPAKIYHEHHPHKKSDSTDLLSTDDPAASTSTSATMPSERVKTAFRSDDPQPPSPANLRNRISGARNNQTQTGDTDIPRRRLSLRPRFFSRAVTAAAAASQRQMNPMSDPVDDRDGAPSPKIGRSRRLSTNRRKSVNIELPLPGRARADSGVGTGGSNGVGSSNNNDNNNSSQNGGTWTSSTPTSNSRNAIATSRPYTSGSTETTKRRPSSFGLFGWMRGATSAAATGTTPSQNKESGNNNNNNNNSRSNTPVRNTPTPTGPRSTTTTTAAAAAAAAATAASTASPTATTPYSTRAQTHNQSYKPMPTYIVAVNARQANNSNHSDMHTSVPLDQIQAFAPAPQPAPADESGAERRASRFSNRRASRKADGVK